MSLMVVLDNGLEESIRAEAKRRGIEAEECARRLLENHFPERGQEDLASVLQSFIDEGDEDEQRETFAALKAGLNESHSSSRKVFRD